ncbi:MAG: hypothetical protein RLY86_2025 [Pseudomonadota bacterium]
MSQGISSALPTATRSPLPMAPLPMAPLPMAVQPGTPLMAARDTILLRLSGELRLSLLPVLRAVIERSRRTGAAVAVTVAADAPSALKPRAEAALLSLGLAAERLHRGPVPPICRSPGPVGGDAGLMALLGELPLFPTAEQVNSWVAMLPTDDRQNGVSKDPDTSPLFQVYALLADPMRTETLRLRFHGGISWEDAKGALVQLIVKLTAEAGRRQADLLAAETGAADRRVAG